MIQITRRLWEEQQVTPQLFADALRSFGEQQLVDLIAIMGTYAGTAILLAAVDMQLP